MGYFGIPDMGSRPRDQPSCPNPILCNTNSWIWSPIFDPYLQKDIDLLEKVQHKFLKLVYIRTKNNNFNESIPDYEELLTFFKLEPLQHRRIKIKLNLFHRIISGTLNIKHNNSYSIKDTQTRGNSQKNSFLFAQTQFAKIHFS